MEDRCGFCGKGRADVTLVRGREAFICSGCVGDGLVALTRSTTAAVLELPEADTTCSFCGAKTPASLLHPGRDRVVICASCLGRSFSFLVDEQSLTRRRATWRNLGEATPASLLAAHFAKIDPDAIVTSSRTFPVYARVDLNRALAHLLGGDGVRCVGLHPQHEHQTLSYGVLLQEHSYISLGPLQFDEVDVGEDEPARCPRFALWLVPGGEVPSVVLLAQQMTYGRAGDLLVEVAIPRGEAGDRVVRALFGGVEAALQASTSYRGKVLSLEHEPHMAGTASSVTVHRLAPVAREEVILPTATLDLLERNVFGFTRQRSALSALGLPVKKGLLFYGPPGTGKTHTIRYLAGTLPGHTTLLLTAEQVGLIQHYLVLARLLSPSILVIEDADLIARQRETMGDVREEVLLNRLLNEMDGLRDNAEILFVLTTNRPEALEEALTARPGRIDQAIEFPLPDEDGRRKLARLYGRGLTLSDALLDHIVERTARTSGAFVKELMRRSAQFSITRGAPELGQADVDAALEEILISGGRLNAALLGALGGLASDVTD